MCVCVCDLGTVSVGFLNCDVRHLVENYTHLHKCQNKMQYLSMGITVIVLFAVFKCQPHITVIFHN